MKAVAAHPNVSYELSDLPVEANWLSWTEAERQPFIEAALEALGILHVMYGGDWPVCLQATTPQRWVEVLGRALTGFLPPELRMFYRDNANRIYRLGL